MDQHAFFFFLQSRHFESTGETNFSINSGPANEHERAKISAVEKVCYLLSGYLAPLYSVKNG